MSAEPITFVGDVWRDRDPRGGPTFRVVGFADDEHVYVADAHSNKRKRRVKIARLPKHYELLKPSRARLRASGPLQEDE